MNADTTQGGQSAHVLIGPDARLIVSGPASACSALWGFAARRPSFVQEIVVEALGGAVTGCGGHQRTFAPSAPLRAFLSLGAGAVVTLSLSASDGVDALAEVSRMLRSITADEAERLQVTQRVAEGMSGSWLSLTGGGSAS